MRHRLEYAFIISHFECCLNQIIKIHESLQFLPLNVTRYLLELHKTLVPPDHTLVQSRHQSVVQINIPGDCVQPRCFKAPGYFSERAVQHKNSSSASAVCGFLKNWPDKCAFF